MKVILNRGNNGNAHTLKGDFTHSAEPILNALTNDVIQVLEISEKGAILAHDEHSTIVLPKGKYFVTNQVEVDPITGQTYQIID